jgi:DUF4097 and DUF4098 domain-containing protein YvlB
MPTRVPTVLTCLAVLAVPSALHAQQRYTLTGERVAIYNLAGQVTLTAGSGGDVVVSVAAGGAQAAQLKVEQGQVRGRQALRVRYPGGDIVYPPLGSGSRTELRVDDDGTFDHQDDHGGRRVRIVGSGKGVEAYADLAVSVPAGRNVAIHLAAGTVTATNVNGSLAIDASSAAVRATGSRGELSVDVGAGNVEVSGMDGPLSIDTGSGDVKITGMRGGALHVDTGSGDVVASDVATDEANVDTGSGSIRFSATRVGRSSFDTGSGDVTVDLAEGPGELSVDTGSGDIVLRLPSSTGAQLSLETSSGRIDTDFPVQVTRTAEDELRGTIGDGRGRISVESGSGSVRLQKR